MIKPKSFWIVAHGILMPLWILGAALNMMQVNGGFLTNYLADLTNPPDVYIMFRGLAASAGLVQPRTKIGQLVKWFGHSPERAALSIFLVGFTSELIQKYWPWLITGTFDPWDIVAYSAGLIICFCFDKFGRRAPL